MCWPSDPGVEAVDAYSLLNTGDQPANEHVFYDLGTAKAVAGRIAERLAEVDPENAGDYRANAAEFGRQADAIAASERAIAQAHPGAPSSPPSPSRTTCCAMPASPTAPRRASPPR